MTRVELGWAYERMPKEQCEIDNVGNVSHSVGTHLNPFLNVSYVFGLSRITSVYHSEEFYPKYKETKSELKKKKYVKKCKTEYKKVYNGLKKSKMRYKKCKANSINMIITFGNGKTDFNKKNK
jgi:hypothetical protein